MQMLSSFRYSLIGCYILVVASFLSSCATATNFKSWEMPQEMVAKIDSVCGVQSEVGYFPGLAVAVVTKNSEIWTKGYGYADMEKGIKVDPKQHLFRIGSISKTVTAAALARLTERKKLNLDAPIADLYKACPEDKKDLTLRLLGGHLGGIRHYRGDEFLSNIHYDNVIDPLEVFIHDTLLCVPGSAFNYTTYGWTLISAVMEWGVHDPFLEIVDEEVAQPLRLEDLTADDLLLPDLNRVSFYGLVSNALVPAPVVDNSNKWAGGGFLCSAEDISRFGYAFVKPGYLKRKTLEAFTTSQQTTSGEITGYGIGFNDNTDDKGRRWIGHSGGSAGGTSMLLIYPKYDLVVVTLVNLSGAKMDQLAHRIADIVLAGQTSLKRSK